MNYLTLVLTFGIGCASFLTAVSKATCQDEDLADDGLARGWVAILRQDEQVVRRIDLSPVIVGTSEEIDPRLDAAPFQLTWEGLLETEARGSYEFAVFSTGQFELRLNDLMRLQASLDQPQWVTSEPVSLSYDLHEIQVYSSHRIRCMPRRTSARGKIYPCNARKRENTSC